MNIKIRVPEGCEMPRFYGAAYWEYFAPYAIAYPVPINLFVRFGRWTWFQLIRFRPTKWDAMLRKAYEDGLAAGRAEARRK